MNIYIQPKKEFCILILVLSVRTHPSKCKAFYYCDYDACYNNIKMKKQTSFAKAMCIPCFLSLWWWSLSDFYFASKHNVFILFCLAYSLFMFPRLSLLEQLEAVNATSFFVHLSILIVLKNGIIFSSFETSEERD